MGSSLRVKGVEILQSCQINFFLTSSSLYAIEMRNQFCLIGCFHCNMSRKLHIKRFNSKHYITTFFQLEWSEGEVLTFIRALQEEY